MNKQKERWMGLLFFLSAAVCVLAVLLICVFLLVKGLPAIGKIGIFQFLFGKNWRPSAGQFGILPMLLGSIYVTACALLIGVPVGLLTAIFLAEYCPPWLYRVLKPGVHLLAGIPSVIYGFFALMVLAPVIRRLFGGMGGKSILTAGLLLGLMILPTVISMSEAAIRAVPKSYQEGALALGATKERSIMRATLPAAKSGLAAGIILGIGRAVGETMAVVMVAGNQTDMPRGLLQGVRTLTANIVIEMGYAADLHREALIATGVVLLLFILLINLLVSVMKRKEGLR